MTNDKADLDTLFKNRFAASQIRLRRAHERKRRTATLILNCSDNRLLIAFREEKDFQNSNIGFSLFFLDIMLYDNRCF